MCIKVSSARYDFQVQSQKMLTHLDFENCPRLAYIISKFDQPDQERPVLYKHLAAIFLSVLSFAPDRITDVELQEASQISGVRLKHLLKKLQDKSLVTVLDENNEQYEGGGTILKKNKSRYLWNGDLPDEHQIADQLQFRELLKDIKRRKRVQQRTATVQQEVIDVDALDDEQVPEIPSEPPSDISRVNFVKKEDSVKNTDESSMRDEREKMNTENTNVETDTLKRKLDELTTTFDNTVSVKKNFANIDVSVKEPFNKKFKSLEGEMLEEPYSKMSTILSELVEILSKNTGYEKKTLMTECPICYCCITKPMTFTSCGHLICELCETKLKGGKGSKAKKECPVCRTISKTIKIYL